MALHKVVREPLNVRPLRTSFVASVEGAQAGNLIIPITRSRRFVYDSAAPPLADSNPDFSRFYQSFGVQTGSTTAKNVQVEIKLAPGDEWVPPPTTYTSDEDGALNPGLITPGEIFFMRLPIPGVMVRLVVDQPAAGTDFEIIVTMSENTDRPLR